MEDFIGAKKKCDRSGEGGTGQRGIGHLVNFSSLGKFFLALFHLLESFLSLFSSLGKFFLALFRHFEKFIFTLSVQWQSTLSPLKAI